MLQLVTSRPAFTRQESSPGVCAFLWTTSLAFRRLTFKESKWQVALAVFSLKLSVIVRAALTGLGLLVIDADIAALLY